MSGASANEASQSNDVLLQLNGIERCFDVGGQELAVLKDITLTIRRGELVAIMGQSGSGKSTLMNILGCLDRPTRGSYLIDGRDVGALTADQLAWLRREYFGFIFQRYHLLPHLSALENVEIPALYAGISKASRHEHARRLLERLGLAQRLNYSPAKLSGGQQQRVSIARALMNGGAVILADEPTGALDTKSGQEVMNILLELHRAGHTVIIVTHDAKVADYAHRIIELRDGHLIADRAHTGLREPEKEASLPKPGDKDDAMTDHEMAVTSLVSKSSSQPTLDAINLKSLGAALKIAWIAMATHRLRTLLTMLGIIIGITAVVLVVALGQGTQRKIVSEFQSFGTNTISIYPGLNPGDENASSIHTLTDSDLVALGGQFYVDSVTPEINASGSLRIANIKANASINGVNEQYFRVRNIKMAAGAGFNRDAVQRHAQIVVIDYHTRERLFKKWEQPIGKTILVNTLPCIVVGVMAKNDTFGGPSSSLQVLIPYTTAITGLTGRPWFDTITVRVRDGIPSAVAEHSLTKLLTARHGRKDFFTFSFDKVIQSIKKSTDTMTLFVLSIAMISLLVGGVGVMNIMLVSVTERTQEIGIRMAVGARQSDILQQFLIEAVLVCLAGGVLGILLSFALGGIFSLLVKIITLDFSIPSIILACACSMLIGVVFGFWPARNAARLDPINALARE